MKRALASLLIACSASFASAATVEIDQLVSSRDNLYYTDWGHWYTMPDDHALGNLDSVAARAVSLGGSSFNFGGFDAVSIFATGSVVDAGGTATSANGDTCVPSCLFKDGNWRGLPAYSLIGIWSSSPDAIVPIGDPHTSVFFVGSNLVLDIPDAPSLYLFLAENDGAFGDNSGSYNVHLTASAVPVPAALPLFLSGVAGLSLIRRRKTRA